MDAGTHGRTDYGRTFETSFIRFLSKSRPKKYTTTWFWRKTKSNTKFTENTKVRPNVKKSLPKLKTSFVQLKMIYKYKMLFVYMCSYAKTLYLVLSLL